MAVLGHLSTSGLLVTKHALDIFIVKTLSSGRLQSFAKVNINHELFKFRSIWLVLLYIVISLYAYFAYALCWFDDVYAARQLRELALVAMAAHEYPLNVVHIINAVVIGGDVVHTAVDRHFGKIWPLGCCTIQGYRFSWNNQFASPFVYVGQGVQATIRWSACQYCYASYSFTVLERTLANRGNCIANADVGEGCASGESIVAYCDYWW